MSTRWKKAVFSIGCGQASGREEVRLKRKIVICGVKMRRRVDDGTEIMPPSQFLKELWTGKLLD